MPIATTSDFVSGILKIPNAVTANAGEAENPDLVKLIEETEKDLLLLLFGKTQYDLLQTALGDMQNADDYLVSLVNGTEGWKGLKPLVLRFIYCSWLRFDEVSYTTTGTGKSKVQNHTVTDMNQKYVERWNEFVLLVDDLRKFILKTDELNLVDSFPCFELENQFGI